LIPFIVIIIPKSECRRRYPLWRKKITGVPAMIPIGMIVIIGVLAALAIITIRRK